MEENYVQQLVLHITRKLSESPLSESDTIYASIKKSDWCEISAALGAWEANFILVLDLDYALTIFLIFISS